MDSMDLIKPAYSDLLLQGAVNLKQYNVISFRPRFPDGRLLADLSLYKLSELEKALQVESSEFGTILLIHCSTQNQGFPAPNYL